MADLEKSLSSIVQRLEAAVARLESSTGGRSVPSPSSSSTREISADVSLDASVSEFDSLIESKAQRVVDAAKKIGGQVLEGSKVLKEAFTVERGIILAISKCKKPEMEELQKLLKPLGDILNQASKLTEGKRTDAYNHLKTIAESLAALTWVAFTGKDCGMSFPAAHVEESWQAAEFYNNKVLVEYRNKDANHADWAKAMKELYLPGLRDYVKKFHATGPSWSAKGVSCNEYLASGTVSAPRPAGKAPPPPPGPPPPPPPIVAAGSDTSTDARPGMNAVFMEINKGEGVTAGLKKVTDDMKTKYRTDRTGAVPVTSSKGSDISTTVAVSKLVKPAAAPKFELQLDRKWVIENQVGNKNLVISKCNAWQSVYIYGCKDSVVQIQGKVNTIALDKCQKTGVVFKDVVSTFEVVNCTSVEVQCQGTAPSISVDNSTGCQIYLSKTSLDACITTAKSSETNVLVPGENEDSDFVEHALAEQFISVYKEGSFVTTPVSHSGG